MWGPRWEGSYVSQDLPEPWSWTCNLYSCEAQSSVRKAPVLRHFVIAACADEGREPHVVPCCSGNAVLWVLGYWQPPHLTETPPWARLHVWKWEALLSFLVGSEWVELRITCRCLAFRFGACFEIKWTWDFHLVIYFPSLPWPPPSTNQW
jgi:hypothetical protein